MNAFLTTALRPLHWAVRTETSGRFVWSLLLADAIVGGFIIRILDGYWLKQHLNWETTALLAAGLIPFHLVGGSYFHTKPRGWPWLAVKIAAASALAAWLYPTAFDSLQIHLGRGMYLQIVGAVLPFQLILHFAHRRYQVATPLEPLRWTLLAAGALGVSYPFLTNGSVGTGDAYWYASMVADFSSQWRAGVFPVFVGQSDFAFNGAVSPLRFAPYLQHLAGIFDLVTGHTLTFFGLLNLCLFSSLLAACFTAYGALVAIDARPRWLALLLTLLYVSSPGVLALAYTGDLFMSLCTLPYIPLVLLGLHRTLLKSDIPGMVLLSGALAAVWQCHPPIAFWLTCFVALGQVLNLRASARGAALWRMWLGGAILFALLNAYLFTSVATLKLPGIAANRDQIVAILINAFPAVFGPVSKSANEIYDYQLGWGLWIALLGGTVGAIIWRRAFSFALLLAVVGALLLLLPLPHVNRWLWHVLPQAVCDLTFLWPMQRLYVLLAALATFLGYVTCADFIAARRWLRWPLGLTLATGLLWSAFEAGAFLQRGQACTTTEESAGLSHLPQNRILTRYAYNPFPAVPAYFSHGYVDPVWENRLLRLNTYQELTSNYRVAIGPNAVVLSTGEITAIRGGPQSSLYLLIGALSPDPGRSYALEFEFAEPELSGLLIVAGATVARNYYLPDSGAGMPFAHFPASFGSRPSDKHAFSLLSSALQTEPLLVHFATTTLLDRNTIPFGRYSLKEYDPSRLPIVVESWMPYRARVTAPARAWLETPRLFISGYRATINDQSAPVARSPDGLVMVQVDAGESRVILSYPGPLSLRGAYYLSLLGWIALAVVLIHRLFQSWWPAVSFKAPGAAQ